MKGIATVVTNIFPKAMHKYCMRHLTENLQSQHKNVYARKQFWKVVMIHRLFDFEQILKHIEDNDRHIHRQINQVGHHRWANIQFQERRYGILTIGKLDIWNAFLNQARRYPICFLIEHTRKVQANHFHKCQCQAKGWEGTLTPKTYATIEASRRKA